MTKAQKRPTLRVKPACCTIVRQKRKRSAKVYILVSAVVSALAVLIVLGRCPPPLASMVERIFGYQLKEEPMIVARSWKKYWWPQGLAYHEETTVRLSAVDYHDLPAHLSGDSGGEWVWL